MKVIIIHRRSCVYYKVSSDSFIKEFTPKFSSKLKYFFKLRKYPGKNFYYISNLLNSLNIKTAKIISYSNYHIETKNIDGITLEEFIKIKGDNYDYIISQYIFLILTLIKNNIYCGDLHFGNFIVKNNELYALDLEDYHHKNIFWSYKKCFLSRLKGKIPKEIFEDIIKQLETT
ncbi:BUD32 family EKC/KEOPS complex subunit [Candidatus Cetobacterium colombiensis]|uniref:Protein kinase domain-containing protein n=1 Tax=Candidatus Cetobacterium colombiensis TaxID=3073100 RepID=A0ABU4WC27_9FUSO|nr:hypothetical protein [Candidatus Cetobacterium colombiensis]MDX8335920.1 hypothetical protein [Candidatus Cetobacterium colombiensis]